MLAFAFRPDGKLRHEGWAQRRDLRQAQRANRRRRQLGRIGKLAGLRLACGELPEQHAGAGGHLRLGLGAGQSFEDMDGKM